MDLSISDKIASFERKVSLLAAQRDDAISRRNAALATIESLSDELRRTRSELQQAKLDAEYLSLSHRLADNPQALAAARASVRNLLSKIDKAIALLENDARI